MKPALIAAILGLTLAIPSFSQWRGATISIETGVPLNASFQGAPVADFDLKERNGYKALAGISAAKALGWNLALRGGVLYRPMAFHRTTSVTRTLAILIMDSNGNILPSPSQHEEHWWNCRGHAWEFPITVRKMFMTRGVVSPFADAGIAMRHTGATTDSHYTFSGSGISASAVAPSETIKDWRTGPVLGAGVEFHRLPFHVSPEVRWTSWLNDGKLNAAGLAGPSRHSLDFLLGIQFR
jgi:opacity protein-like surface antigen